jgi:hypothetical protein
MRRYFQEWWSRWCGLQPGRFVDNDNCTISSNRAGDGGFSGTNSGGGSGGSGGGIYTQNGNLNLTNVTMTNNRAGNATEGNSGGGSGGSITRTPTL